MRLRCTPPRALATGGPVESSRNEARGGESERLRAVWMATGIADVAMLSRSSGSCTSRGASRLRVVIPCCTARSVYGFAVAAAWREYILYKPCGVAAPGLLSVLSSPPTLRMAATSSVGRSWD